LCCLRWYGREVGLMTTGPALIAALWRLPMMRAVTSLPSHREASGNHRPDAPFQQPFTFLLELPNRLNKLGQRQAGLEAWIDS